MGRSRSWAPPTLMNRTIGSELMACAWASSNANDKACRVGIMDGTGIESFLQVVFCDTKPWGRFNVYQVSLSLAIVEVVNLKSKGRTITLELLHHRRIHTQGWRETLASGQIHLKLPFEMITNNHDQISVLNKLTSKTAISFGCLAKNLKTSSNAEVYSYPGTHLRDSFPPPPPLVYQYPKKKKTPGSRMVQLGISDTQWSDVRMLMMKSTTFSIQTFMETVSWSGKVLQNVC